MQTRTAKTKDHNAKMKSATDKEYRKENDRLQFVSCTNSFITYSSQ